MKIKWDKGEKLTPKQDLQDWLSENWFKVEDSIGFALSTFKGTNLNNVVDRDKS